MLTDKNLYLWSGTRTGLNTRKVKNNKKKNSECPKKKIGKTLGKPEELLLKKTLQESLAPWNQKIERNVRWLKAFAHYFIVLDCVCFVYCKI